MTPKSWNDQKAALIKRIGPVGEGPIQAAIEPQLSRSGNINGAVDNHQTKNYQGSGSGSNGSKPTGKLSRPTVSAPPTTPGRKVDIVHDPTGGPTKDILVKLELPIDDDFEAELDEFCRLRRLGLFKQAKEHFDIHLSQAQDDPYVLVQYGEMLVAAGDYQGFAKIQYHQEPSSDGLEFAPPDPLKYKLDTNFILLSFLAQKTFPGYTERAVSTVEVTLKTLKTERLSERLMGSTEVSGTCTHCVGLQS